MTGVNLVDKINFERVIDSAILAKGEKGLAGIASSAQLRPWIMSGLYLGSDAAAVFLSWILAYFLRDLAGGALLPELYIELWPFVFLFLLAYAATGLYPAVGVPSVEEIRRTTIATTIVFTMLAAWIFLSRLGFVYSRIIFMLSWGFAALFVPLGRAATRRICARKKWWGVPVVVLGAGKTGYMVVKTLLKTPGLGLNPVAVLDDDPQKRGDIEGVPVIGGMEVAPHLAKKLKLRYAILAMPGVPRERLLYLIERYASLFSHLLLIPDLFGFASLWVYPKDLNGILCLEVRQQLLRTEPRVAKSALDFAIAIFVFAFALILIPLIAIAIKLDSPGPVFYGQLRYGRDGQPFKAWKFRTMVVNADKILDEHLAKHPELKEEWEKDQKLRNDPRITRVGKYLRKTSLDELPQVWNVIRGEMSIVGPRPIVQSEIEKYGKSYALYTKVKPGITGLWQVSGRNDLSYEERVTLDSYYVRNWSVWLDIYILARTVPVALFGKGAY